MTSPVPPINPGNRDYRIGDAERQEAMDALGKHFTAGRLDVTEYDNRLASITNAVMQSDLAPVFADLPPLVSPSPIPVPVGFCITPADSRRLDRCGGEIFGAAHGTTTAATNDRSPAVDLPTVSADPNHPTTGDHGPIQPATTTGDHGPIQPATTTVQRYPMAV